MFLSIHSVCFMWFQVMKFARPIMYYHPDTKPSGKSKLLMERSAATKCDRQLLVSRQPQAIAQCGPYQDVWIPKQASTQQTYSWQPDILQINGFNQSPSSCSEWNSAGPTVRRPLTRQSSLENSTKSSYSQVSLNCYCHNFNLNIFQLMP